MTKCTNCGEEFNGIFCPNCGHKAESIENAGFCVQCGAALKRGDKFCVSCGKPVSETVHPANKTEKPNPTVINPDGIKTKVKDTLYKMAGESDDVKIKLSDLFSAVFKKHSSDESEKIFICGTKSTTPELSEINTSWPHPWLYSRIFLVMFISSLFMFLCVDLFSNINCVPGLIIFGSFTVPFTCLFFFYEVNAPQNISFFNMMKYFLVGGCASLFVTLILYSFFSIGNLSFIEAIVVSLVEEVGKTVIVAFIISRVKPKFRLNGIVIGAAVGAGFAALESAGYAFTILLYTDLGSMMSNIYLRGFLSPGGHIVWAAIIGYAIVLARGEDKFSVSVLFKPQFLKLFVIPFVLHALWDMPINFLSEIYFIQILLTFASWCVMLVLISAGLKQVNNIINSSKSGQTDGSIGQTVGTSL